MHIIFAPISGNGRTLYKMHQNLFYNAKQTLTPQSTELNSTLADTKTYTMAIMSRKARKTTPVHHICTSKGMA
jgi:hypothetical protein